MQQHTHRLGKKKKHNTVTEMKGAGASCSCMQIRLDTKKKHNTATEMKGAAAHRETGRKEKAQHSNENERCSSTDRLDTKEHNTATKMKGAAAHRMHTKN